MVILTSSNNNWHNSPSFLLPPHYHNSSFPHPLCRHISHGFLLPPHETITILVFSTPTKAQLLWLSTTTILVSSKHHNKSSFLEPLHYHNNSSCLQPPHKHNNLASFNYNYHINPGFHQPPYHHSNENTIVDETNKINQQTKLIRNYCRDQRSYSKY